ncbi:hypothetical protein ACQYZN_25905 [Pseudomonas aeruginosa]|uniref:hypothetical protein n=1 Tax=Pseudomonas aeruginosa TaxID=287 RepID=UPI003D2B9A1C
MSSTQHQLIEQCAIRLRGIVEALDNIHDSTQHRSPHRWSTDLDDVHSSAESLLALINDQASPSEDQLIAAGLSYPLAKEDAVKLWYAGFRSEVVTVLEAWEAIGHDIGMNPSKGELLDSLRNMAAICNAHGNDMPAQSAIDQRQVIADAITGALAFGAQASQPPTADHWLRPFYDIGRAEGQRTQDLAMLVRMLASSLKRHAPESNLVARATNYLAAKGLSGTPLRDSSASVEQAGGDERAAFFKHLIGRHPAHETEIVRVLEHNYAAWKAWQARAALARVAELEKQEPVAHLRASDLERLNQPGIAGSAGSLWNGPREGFVPLYAAPVAQAQHSVPEGYALIPVRETEAMHDAVMALLYKGVARTDTQKLLDAYIAAAPGTEVPQAWLDVQAERRRQITAEGWTPEHDDEHSHGQMARAAACYALAGSSAPNDGTAALLVSLAWPWDEQWWKPSTARRDMVKACALGLAEIERLDRAGISQSPQPGATTASS